MTDDPVLLSHRDGGVMTLTLNRPKANAFNEELSQPWSKRCVAPRRTPPFGA